MRLNHDYVRDILLYIEEKLEYEDPSNPAYHEEMFFGTLLTDSYFEKYDKQELNYALELLVKERFIDCEKEPYFVRGSLMNANIIGLTWNGHAFLDNIRNDTAWNAVKEKTKKVGSASIMAMAGAAGQLATAMLTDSNALNNFLQGTVNVINMIPH